MATQSRGIGLTKLWEMLDDYTGVLEPQSLRSDQILAARNCAVPRQHK